MTWSDKTLAAAAGMALVRRQLRRTARGGEPALSTRPACALVSEQLVARRQLRRCRARLPDAASHRQRAHH